MTPLLLDLRRKFALVVGGGPVGLRRAKALLDAGARVRLVSPAITSPEPFPSAVEWLQVPFDPAHLEGVDLVVAAAPHPVNLQVAQAARERRIWCNCASEAEAGDVAFPAAGRRGDVTLAVSTGGASPKLGADLRDWLLASIPAAWLAGLSEYGKMRFENADKDRRGELLRQLQELFAGG